ncbi:MAG: YncE family protein [Mucilaginibacter sp.]
MKKYLLQITLIAVLGLNNVFAQNKPGYHIVDDFHIKSGGGWDYITVDSASDKLYVSHGLQVNVLNKTTGDSLGVISATKDVHGIALVQALGKGYISNGSSNSVLVFDLQTNKVLAHVPTGKFSDGIFYDDFSKKVISCNGMSKNMTVIDPVTDEVVATIQLSGWPETATSDGAGKIYVNNAEKSEIDVIDAQTFKIVHKWPIAPAKGPSGLTIDRSTMRLFAGCENKLLAVINARTGKVISTLPIGDGCDAVGFDHKLKTVFSSNGEGTLTVIKEISANKFVVAEKVVTKKGARTMAVDQTTHKLYLPTGQFKAGDKSERPPIIPGTFNVLVISK